MKQLGNLAVICAKRDDTIFLMRKGMVRVIVHHINGNGTKTLDAKWTMTMPSKRSATN